MDTRDTSHAGAGRVIARSVSSTLLGTVVSGVAAFVLTIVITRGVSQDTAGTLFAVTSVFVLLNSLGQFGTQTGLVYFIPRTIQQECPERALAYIQTARRPVMTVAFVTAVGLYTASGWVGRLVAGSSIGSDVARDMARILALFLPLIALELLNLAATRGLGRMRAYTVIELITRPLLQVGLVAAAIGTGLADRRPALLAAAWVLPYLPAAIASSIALRRRLRAGRFQQSEGTCSVDVRREFWRYTWPRGLTNLTQVSMQRLDVVLVAALASPAQAALYLAATRFVVLGQLAAGAMAMATQPALASSIARDDAEGTRDLFHTSTTWLMIVTWPVYLVLAVNGDGLLRVFGEAYDVGAAVLLILSAAMLYSTGVGQVDVLLNMAGRTWVTFANSATALAVMIVADLALIPHHGAVGAAIGWAAAIVVRNTLSVIQVWHSRRLLATHPASLLVALISALSFGLVGLASRSVVSSPVSAVLTSVAVGCLVYLALLLILRVPLGLHQFLPLRGRGNGSHVTKA